MKKVNVPDDPYIRLTKAVTPRAGFTALDEVRATGGPSLTRVYERVPDEKQSRFDRNPEKILCPGAALGRDAAGEVHHYRQGLKFIGFLIANGESDLAVKVRGSIVLSIPGAFEVNRGDSVYCSGPNTFSLEPIGAEIGKVRYYQDGRCAVAFRRQGDEKPLDLRIDIH